MGNATHLENRFDNTKITMKMGGHLRNLINYLTAKLLAVAVRVNRSSDRNLNPPAQGGFCFTTPYKLEIVKERCLRSKIEVNFQKLTKIFNDQKLTEILHDQKLTEILHDQKLARILDDQKLAGILDDQKVTGILQDIYKTNLDFILY
uniref:Uncharacterized protein n=1 Tax=Glossina austeni TaxID=7395 RepID=A0A1A9VWM0_GLOAU